MQGVTQITSRFYSYVFFGMLNNHQSPSCREIKRIVSGHRVLSCCISRPNLLVASKKLPNRQVLLCLQPYQICSLLHIVSRRSDRLLSQMASMPFSGFLTDQCAVVKRAEISELKRHDKREYPLDLLRVTPLAAIVWTEHLHNLIISRHVGAV